LRSLYVKSFVVLAVLSAVMCAQALRPSQIRNDQLIRREAAPYAIVNAASERGIIAPGVAAIIRGSGFARSSTFAVITERLPTTLAGISVRISGIPAQLYAVTPTEIFLIVPDTRLHSLQSEWLTAEHLNFLGSWQQIEISTPGGEHKLWAPLAESSPGIYLQNGYPQALFYRDGLVGVIGQNPVYGGSQVVLKGTGFTHAAQPLIVHLSSADGSQAYSLPGRTGKPDIVPWVDSCGFDLPKDLHGKVRLVVQSGDQANNQMFSNEVWFTVE
jgi:uncharacterized protein (TIGR03437 family)